MKKQNDISKQIKEEQGTMNPTVVKILITLATVGSIGAIAFGVTSYQTAKEQELKNVTQNVKIEVQDLTDQKQEKPQAEQLADRAINEKFAREGIQLWNKNKNKFAIDKSLFCNKYVAYRKDGLSVREAYNSLYNEYAIANQVIKNNSNATSEDAEIEDEYDQAYQDQLDTEEGNNLQQETSNDFEVLYMDTTTMYAQQKVNMRGGPGVNYEKIDSYNQNDAVTVIGIVPNTGHGAWFQIGTEDREVVGYIHENYIDYNKVQVKQQPTQQTTETNNQTTNNSSSIDLSNLSEEFEIGGDYQSSGSGLGSTTGGSGEFAGIQVY